MIIGISTTKDGIFMSLYIDAVVVKGTRRVFGCTVNTKTQNEAKDEFAPLDLTPYSVRFRVLGSATADAKVLLEKIITQTTDEESIGIINDAENGQFEFVINIADTQLLGLGKFAIMIELLDANTLEPQITLTEGGYNGEFNKLQIVQV